MTEAAQQKCERNDLDEQRARLPHRQPTDHEQRVTETEHQDGDNRPPTRHELTKEEIRRSYGQQADRAMERPHRAQVDPTEQLAELPPDNQEESRMPQVVAEPEEVAVPSMRPALGSRHDRDLVGAHLYRPVVDLHDVEGGEEEGDQRRCDEVGSRDPR